MKRAKKICENALTFILAMSLIICMNPVTIHAKTTTESDVVQVDCKEGHEEGCEHTDIDSETKTSLEKTTNGETASESVVQPRSVAQPRAAAITSVDALNAAIASSTGTKENPTQLVIDSGGISVTKTISVSGKHVSLTGGTLTRGNNFTNEMILISNQGSLTLADITLDGNAVSGVKAMIIVEDSTLTTQAGTILQNNKESAVKVWNRYGNKATFIMNDGIIQNNSASNGAGVTLTNSASMLFQMNGGKIQHNTATVSGSAIFEAGYTTDPTIEINGGEIKNNKVEGTNLNGSFGTIYSAGTLIITGGTISNNTTVGRGGGVYKSDRIFTMSGGTIENNTERFGLNPGDYSSSTGNNVAMLKGTMNLSGSASIPNGLFLDKRLKVNITGALTGSFGIEKLDGTLPATFGDVIATGLKDETTNLYTITQDDVSKFSYKDDAFAFSLDTTNNQIKLAKMPEDPTIDTDNNKIFMNGSPIILTSGSENPNYTVIYVDKNRNGIVDSSDKLWAPDGMDKTVIGNILGHYSVYGGSQDDEIDGTSITMLGGKVNTIFAGTDALDFTGDTNFNMTGGTVTNIYGGSRTGNITGNTNVTISGGNVTYMVYAGAYNGAISGNTNLTIKGGIIESNIFGGGADVNATVGGNTNITMSGGSALESLYGSGGNAGVTGNTAISITGGTIQKSVYGGNSKNAVVQKNSSISITGGEILGNVFGGGKNSAYDVQGTKSIKVGGNAIVGSPHDIYAYGIVFNSKTFTNGVDSFEIADDISVDASIHIALHEAFTKAEFPKLIASNASLENIDLLTKKGNGATDTAFYYDEIEKSIKLKRTKFDITFDSKEGSSISGSNVNEGEKITKPTDPTKEGYHFDAWYKDDTFQTKWAFDTDTVTEDTTLYANWVDDIDPDAEISLDTNAWKSFLNFITFDLFFKDTKKVTIKASDDGSGLKEVEYLLSETSFATPNDITGTWESVTLDDGSFELDLNKNSKQFVYVKAVDNAGNQTIVNSEGIVLYSESKLKSDSAEFNMDKQEDIKIATELNENEFKDIYNADVKLVKDVDYSILSEEITIKKGYLANALTGKEVNLLISYKPMGVDTEHEIEKNQFKITRHQHTSAEDDGDCSTAIICEKCGFVIKAAKTHEWSSEWESDGTHHWHNCVNEGCTKTSEKVAHEGEDDGDCTTPILCKECGFVIKEAQTHEWSEEWESDGTHHWHNCVNEGCTKTSSKVEHVGVDDGDCTTPILCEECGYEIKAAQTHQWSEEWESDGTHHWHNCLNEDCTKTNNKAEHVGEDDGDCTTPVLCEKCGYVIKEAQTHQWSEEWESDGTHHWHNCVHEGCTKTSEKVAHSGEDDGDCTTPILCEKCGFVIKAAQTHEWSEEFESNGTHHWHDCVNEDCTKTSEKVAHVGEDDGDCTTALLCEECGAVIREAQTHQWSTEWKSDGKYHWHECMNEGCTKTSDKTKHSAREDDGDCTTPILCEECSHVIKAAQTHQWSKEWRSDEKHHWHECINEGCTKLSEKVGHSWDDGIITTPPTTSEEGVMTYTCKVCGHTKTQAIPTLPKENQLIDTETGLKAEYVDGSGFDSNTVLRVVSKPQEEKDKVKDAVTKAVPGTSIAGLYDVMLLKDGVEIQPSGKLKILVPLTKEMKEMEDLQVIYINDDGVVSVIPSEVKVDYIEFMTDHFSDYGVIGKVKVVGPSDNGNSGTTDNTGGNTANKDNQTIIKETGGITSENSFLQRYGMVLVVSGGVILMFRQRKTVVVDIETEECFIGIANKLRFLRFLISQAWKEGTAYLQMQKVRVFEK